MQALLTTFIIIAVAELGDKTQLLTFGFATRYPLWEVISAVFCASAALMAIAVLLGGIINQFVPQTFISLLAGSLFIIFGIWTMFGKGEEEEAAEGGKGAPFWIVFSGFLLAELGDKTQIATLALSAEYGAPLFVWAGATAAMVAVNSLGALTGKVVGRFLPERAVKLFGAAIFILFGLATLGDLFIW